MPAQHRLALHWFRRDLRITDNRALLQASEHAKAVLPVYVLSAWRGAHAWTGPKRQAFLCGALESLAGDLRTLGGRLLLRCGDPLNELRILIGETRAGLLTFARNPDPFGRDLELRVAAMCRELGVECIGCDDHSLHPPEEVLTGEGRPFRVFTPYSRAWFAREKPRPLGRPDKLASPPTPASLPLPGLGHWQLDAPGTNLPDASGRAALRRLDHAVDAVLQDYAEMRDLPAADATSRLSQDLRWGLVSPRAIHAKATANAGDVNHKFLAEIAWREFYFSILHHFPEVLETEFNPTWRGLPWDEPGERFMAWCEGRTGFPIVDAGIRQLLTTGWMHNRVRMITAMFLTKDLHIDWRLGEQFFIRHLIDGEIASNNGGWQWSAGTGADAAPYFRIQNPWLQTARYDPDGAYIRRWIPELAGVPPARLKSPPKDGHPIAPGYPHPIVDHATERKHTLAIFQHHKEQSR